jgi:hypothetical protein
MPVLNIQVDERGVKQVKARAGTIAEANEIATLSARISVGLDLIGRLAVGDDKERPTPTKVELVGDAARIAELEAANRQLQSFANELVRAVNDDEEDGAPGPVTDADWFHNGYDLASTGAMPHLRSPEVMWSGWAWGFLERTKHFPKIVKTRKSRKG